MVRVTGLALNVTVLAGLGRGSAGASDAAGKRGVLSVLSVLLVAIFRPWARARSY